MKDPVMMDPATSAMNNHVKIEVLPAFENRKFYQKSRTGNDEIFVFFR